MIADCLRVRRRIQERLDGAEGGLSDRDALHLQSCPRCGGLLRAYSAFGRELRLQANAEAARTDVPSWEAVFAAAGSTTLEAADQADAVPSPVRTGAIARARMVAAARRRGRPGTSGRYFGIVQRRLPAWSSRIWLRAALIAVILGLGALFGVQEHRAALARSFVRSSTTEFVNTIFASSIFSASPDATTAQGVVEDAAWFDATDSADELPLAPIPPEGKTPNPSPAP